MDLHKDLNPQQHLAVTAPGGPALVLAGPGSGKTRVLTHRIAYLVHSLEIDPNHILAVTFTNKAAREMRARVISLLDGSPLQNLRLGTFHAYAARMLRREADRLPVDRDYVIFDEADQRTLVSAAIKDLNLDPKQVQVSTVHGAISRAKNELISPEDYQSSSYFGEIVGRIYERYQKLLLANNALDFDDLLIWPVNLFRQDLQFLEKYRRHHRYLLVDEFQDTNIAQYELLRLLAGDDPDLFVVGDPDQSIYRWRGADYRNVRRFQEDFPQAQTYLLEQNYRSTQTILDAAMSVIDKQPGRTKKKLFTELGEGDPIVLHEAYDESEEAQFVVDSIAQLALAGEAEPGETAVMYRTNAQSRALEEVFLKAGLPYRIVGAQRFYGRREVKDLIAYLRIIHSGQDQVSLLRILNTPSRGIGAKTVARLLQVADTQEMTAASILLDLAQLEESHFAEQFSLRARDALAGFGAMLQELQAAEPEIALESLIDRVLLDSGYADFIQDGTDEGFERWENLMELRKVAEELTDTNLARFLEQVALVSDQDTLTDEQNAPTLLTLHASKGLEFPVVFIVGLDEGELPHQRSYEDAEAMAEERRLFYVGITRTKRKLFLVRAFRRRMFGTSSVCDASRFLEDLPADRVDGELIGLAAQAQASYSRQTSWEAPSAAPRSPNYQVGMAVRHPTFGEGIVTSTELDRDDEEVTVEFTEAGVKRLAASMANLEIVEE
jgi:DNA helicase-2/ATP-dependent DNA helicase PcrA